MISPETPAGTEIICIDASPGRFGPSRLQQSALYTVKKIAPAIHENFVVFLHEIEPAKVVWPPFGYVSVGWSLSRFRYLNLPVTLTQLQRGIYYGETVD